MAARAARRRPRLPNLRGTARVTRRPCSGGSSERDACGRRASASADGARGPLRPATKPAGRDRSRRSIGRHGRYGPAPPSRGTGSSDEPAPTPASTSDFRRHGGRAGGRPGHLASVVAAKLSARHFSTSGLLFRVKDAPAHPPRPARSDRSMAVPLSPPVRVARTSRPTACTGVLVLGLCASADRWLLLPRPRSFPPRLNRPAPSARRDPEPARKVASKFGGGPIGPGTRSVVQSRLAPLALAARPSPPEVSVPMSEPIDAGSRQAASPLRRPAAVRRSRSPIGATRAPLEKDHGRGPRRRLVHPRRAPFPPMSSARQDP